MKRIHPILVFFLSFLLAAAVVAGSWLTVFYHASILSYSEVSFTQFQLQDNQTFTFTADADQTGIYLYSLSTVQEGDELRLILRGGKQASRAWPDGSTTAHGKHSASFTVSVPADVKRIVCGKTTVYTIHKD